MKKVLIFSLLIVSIFLFGCKKFNNKIENESYDINIEIDEINKAYVPASKKGLESNVGIILYTKEGYSSYRGTSFGSAVVYKGFCYLNDGTKLNVVDSKNYNNVSFYEYYCITNNHVIQANSLKSKVKVYIPELEILEDGEVLGKDRYSDIAIVKFISSIYITPATIGNSDELEPGEVVIAIGNPAGMQYSNSVTVGHVSYVNRVVDVNRDLNDDGIDDFNGSCYFIQHDAAINSGSSGGALVNIKGEVVGINVMKLFNSSEQLENMSFSIPINTILPNLESLENGNDVSAQKSFGTFYSINDIKNSDVSNINKTISYDFRYNLSYGLYAYFIDDNKYGVKTDDIIISINDKNICSLSHLLCSLHYDKTMKFKVFRNGEIIEFTYSE